MGDAAWIMASGYTVSPMDMYTQCHVAMAADVYAHGYSRHAQL
jgi:hypothetical protein